MCIMLLTSPRGITAARPPFFILRSEAKPLGFIDIGDLKLRRCLLEPCFEFFEFSENGCQARCFGKALWASWEALGSSWADLEPSGPALGVS